MASEIATEVLFYVLAIFFSLSPAIGIGLAWWVTH